MKTTRRRSASPLRATLALTAVIILMLSLPLLAVVSVVLRVSLLAALLVLGVGAVIAHRTSPRFRAWFDAFLDEQPAYKGLRLRDSIALSDGHSWVRAEQGRAIVGMDDLAQSALGPVDHIDLPEPGSYFRRGEPFVALQHGSRQLEIASPLTGAVVRRNISLFRDPSRANKDPYGAGWMVELREEDPSEHARLHAGSDARPWFREEIDRFIHAISPETPYGTAMADGGVLVDELHRALDDASWDRVRHEFFEVQPREE